MSNGISELRSNAESTLDTGYSDVNKKLVRRNKNS